MGKNLKAKTLVSKFLFEGKPNGGESFTERYSNGRLLEKVHTFEPDAKEHIEYEYDTAGHLIKETSTVVLNSRPRTNVREYTVCKNKNGNTESRYEGRGSAFTVIEYKNDKIISKEEMWNTFPDKVYMRDQYDEKGEKIEQLIYNYPSNGSLIRIETLADGNVTTKRKISFNVKFAKKDPKKYEVDEKPQQVITTVRTVDGMSAHTIESDEKGKILSEMTETLDNFGNTLSSVLQVQKQMKGNVLIAQQQRKEQTNIYDFEGDLVSSFIKSYYPEGHSCETQITYEY